jgi:hypothetical protein
MEYTEEVIRVMENFAIQNVKEYIESVHQVIKSINES